MNGLDLLAVGLFLALIAVLLAAVPLAEGERKTRRRQMGLPPEPSPLSELRAQHNEQVDRALSLQGIEPLEDQALGHERIGLDRARFYKPTVEDEIRADRLADFDPELM